MGASDREVLLNLWQSQNPRSFRILNAKKSEDSLETAILENLRILGFESATVHTPLIHSMSSKSGSISISFSTSSELAEQLWEFLKHPEYEKRSVDANRAEFGGDVSAYILLTGNLLYHDFREYAYVKDCLAGILKMNPAIHVFTLSHASFTIGSEEPKGVAEICREWPEIAKSCCNVRAR